MANRLWNLAALCQSRAPPDTGARCHAPGRVVHRWSPRHLRNHREATLVPRTNAPGPTPEVARRGDLEPPKWTSTRGRSRPERESRPEPRKISSKREKLRRRSRGGSLSTSLDRLLRLCDENPLGKGIDRQDRRRRSLGEASFAALDAPNGHFLHSLGAGGSASTTSSGFGPPSQGGYARSRGSPHHVDTSVDICGAVRRPRCQERTNRGSIIAIPPFGGGISERTTAVDITHDVANVARAARTVLQRWQRSGGGGAE